MKTSEKLLSAAETLFGFIGIVMILVETYAVLARNVLIVSTPWVDELLKLLFVWIVFVGSALAFQNDELISLTLFEDKAKEKKQMVKYTILKTIQYVIALGVSALVVTQMYTIITTQMTTGEASTVMKYPLWVLNSGIMVGMVLIVIMAVVKLVACIKFLANGNQAETVD